eukprot:scaffold151690_cov45-Attheya_sp.AAC.1
MNINPRSSYKGSTASLTTKRLLAGSSAVPPPTSSNQHDTAAIHTDHPYGKLTRHRPKPRSKSTSRNRNRTRSNSSNNPPPAAAAAAAVATRTTLRSSRVWNVQMPTVLATRALLGMQHKVSALRQTRRIHVEIHHAPLPSSLPSSPLSCTSSQNSIRDSHSHSHSHSSDSLYALQQHPPFISSVDVELSEGVAALAASSSSQEVVPGVMEGLLRMDENAHGDMDSNAVPDEMVQLYPGETVWVRILRPATKREQHTNTNTNMNLSCDNEAPLEDQYGYYNNNGEDGEMIHSSSDHDHNDNNDDDVASVVSTLGIQGADDVYQEGVISHWVCTHRLALDQCTIVRSTTMTCDIRLGGGGGGGGSGSGGVGKKTIKRHLKFANAKEAKSFVTFLQTLHHATKSQQQSQQSQQQPVSLPFRHTSSTSLQDGLLLSNSSSSLLFDTTTTHDEDDEDTPEQQQQQVLLTMKSSGDSQHPDKSQQQIMEPVMMEKADRVVSAATTALDRNVTRNKMSPLNGGEFSFSSPQTILVELISATDLIASSSSLLLDNDCQTNPNGAEPTTTERAACNPFCSVYQGTNEIHRTPPIHQTNHPIWTVPTGSLFLISISQPQQEQEQDSLILFRLTHFVSSNDDNSDNDTDTDHYHIGS